MAYNGNFINNLNKRQLDCYYNRNCFKKNIIENFYESSSYLFKTELNLPQNYKSDITGIEFSKDKNFLVSASSNGTLLWNINDGPFFSMTHNMMKLNNECDVSKIVLSYDSKILFNSGKDSSSFSKNHITSNDTATGEIIDKKIFDCTITDISNSPINSNIVAVSCGKSSFYIYDLKSSNVQLFKNDSKQLELFYNSIKYHPLQENLLLVTTKFKNGIYVFDLRNRQFVFNYDILYNNEEDSVVAKYNSKGSQIIVTRKYLCPLLFNVDEKYPVFEFDSFGYHNFTGKKAGCFAGPNDEYIIAGSDNFNIYMWEMPKDTFKNTANSKLPKKAYDAKFVLKGHKGIVKGVSYNYANSIIASYGSDKEICLWSPFSFCKESELNNTCLSSDMSHERYLNYINIDSMYSTFGIFLRSFFSSSVSLFSEDTEVINYLLNMQKKLYYNELSITLPENVYDMDFKYIEIFSKKNLNYNFIRIFLDNYTVNDRIRENEILTKIKDILESNFDERNLHMQHVSLLFEIKKIFQTKNLIQNCIDYLSRVFKKLNNPEVKKFTNENKTILNKTLKDLIIITRQNKDLYENSFKLMKKLLSQFDSINSLDKFKSKFVDDYYTEVTFLKIDTNNRIENINKRQRK